MLTEEILVVPTWSNNRKFNISFNYLKQVDQSETNKPE